MSNTDYVRQSAEKYGWKKYYSTLRPVSIGTQPKNGFMDFINYDDRTEVDSKMVWAELYYNRELTEKEMKDYDLVKYKGRLISMLKIKRYLGYTDGIKEPRKTKVENELSRCYSYKGNIYNVVEFLCTKLLEGCYLEKEENYTKLKRNGERTKPKTLYMFFDKDERRYFEMNKTQYNFVQYLLNAELT